MNSELYLIKKIQDGDKELFAVLVDAYKERALRTAWFFTQNWEDAKDVSQKAFIKAYRHLRSFKGSSTFYTWFYRILSNTAKDFLRSRWWHNLREHPRRTQDGTEDPLDQVSDKKRTTTEIVMNQELFQHIGHFIGELPAGQKDVVILRYNDELSLEEIALALGKSIGTVKSQLFQAHQRLKNKCAQYLEGGMDHVEG